MTDKLFLSLVHCRRAVAETLTDRRDTLGIYNYQPPSVGIVNLRRCSSATRHARAAGRYHTPLIGDDCSVTSPKRTRRECGGVGRRERSRVIDWPIQMLMNARSEESQKFVGSWLLSGNLHRQDRSVFWLSYAKINKLLSKDVDPNRTRLAIDIRYLDSGTKKTFKSLNNRWNDKL